ncbi:hypothetical protein WJX79_007758 [Trebouxia sp. C0005]|nr:MAG: hypothetical protein FRX49_07916 [Trebouxia sp. A1-2]
MSLFKSAAVLFCLQLLAVGASAQAEAFASAGDASALAGAGVASSVTTYVQPITAAFAGANPYNAAAAIKNALANNQAASILQAFTQAKSSNVQVVLVCDCYNYSQKISQAVAQACAEAIASTYGGSTCSNLSLGSTSAQTSTSTSGSGAEAVASAGK